jgi:hypothetical protein
MPTYPQIRFGSFVRPDPISSARCWSYRPGPSARYGIAADRPRPLHQQSWSRWPEAIHGGGDNFIEHVDVLRHQIGQGSTSKGFRNVGDSVPSPSPFDRPGWNPAAIGHDPPRHHPSIKQPPSSPRRTRFGGRRKSEWALKGSNPDNSYRLAFLNHGVSERVEPLRNWVAAQFSADGIPPSTPIIVRCKVAFQVRKGPCNRSALFQEVADRRFGSAFSWRVLKVFHSVSHGFQHFKCVSDSLSGRYCCARHFLVRSSNTS